MMPMAPRSTAGKSTSASPVILCVWKALTNSSSLSCPNHRHTSAVFQPSTSEGASETEAAGANAALNGAAAALGGTARRSGHRAPVRPWLQQLGNHTFDGAAVTAKGDGKDLASAATAKGDAEDPAPAEAAKGDQRLQIVVMIRCDVFRDYRARKINSTVGLVEFFRVVNCTVAQHLAHVPVALLDLTEVLAEVARTDFVSDRL